MSDTNPTPPTDTPPNPLLAHLNGHPGTFGSPPADDPQTPPGEAVEEAEEDWTPPTGRIRPDGNWVPD